MFQFVLILLQITNTIICGELATEKCVQNCLRRLDASYVVDEGYNDDAVHITTVNNGTDSCWGNLLPIVKCFKECNVTDTFSLFPIYSIEQDYVENINKLLNDKKDNLNDNYVTHARHILSRDMIKRAGSALAGGWSKGKCKGSNGWEIEDLDLDNKDHNTGSPIGDSADIVNGLEKVVRGKICEHHDMRKSKFQNVQVGNGKRICTGIGMGSYNLKS